MAPRPEADDVDYEGGGRVPAGSRHTAPTPSLHSRLPDDPAGTPIHCFFDEQEDGTLDLDVDLRLHYGASDRAVYKNTVYTPNQGTERRALQALLKGLIGDPEYPVESCRIQCFRLTVNYSRAISAEVLVRDIMQFLRDAGYDPLWVSAVPDNQPDSRTTPPVAGENPARQ